MNFGGDVGRGCGCGDGAMVMIKGFEVEVENAFLPVTEMTVASVSSFRFSVQASFPLPRFPLVLGVLSFFFWPSSPRYLLSNARILSL